MTLRKNRISPRAMSDKKKSSGKPTRKTSSPSRGSRNASYRPNAKYSGTRRRRAGRFRDWLTRQRWWGAVVRIIMAGFIFCGLALVYFAVQLPDIRDIDTIKKEQGITIETTDGKVLANYGDVYGTYISYDELPKSLIHAVIATEDRRFFEHGGLDFYGIARAMVTNITHGKMVQGGSTITQQVAKNVFLTPERTLSRKVQEAMLAFWLEARFTKKEIMAIYLNRVYLGSGAFGVDAASRRYYNKSAKELNLYESAMMAGLLKAPSRYSPTANSERSKGRVHQVLMNMVDAGFLKEKDVTPTLAADAKAPAHQVEGGDVRYYTDWIVDDEIPRVIGQFEGDMIVTVAMDSKLQTMAQDAVQNVVTMQGAKKNVTQGALVAMKPDGQVVALIGGMDYATSQFNRAAQAKRQPGSVFKLFVYLAGLEGGLSPQSMMLDAPVSLRVGNKTWSPENYAGGYRGDLPMVEALRHSLNTVSVRIGQYVGFSKVAEMAMRLGIPNIPNSPSIVLGSVEATLLEMVGGYAHLANDGNRVVPYGILKVRAREGKEIYTYKASESESVISTSTVAEMNYMLLDAVAYGTGTGARLGGRPVAGKTGTSQDFKDAWFIGFTSQMVTGVWVGNDNNKPMRKITGGTIPASVWREFMARAMVGQPVKSIPSSAGAAQEFLPWLFGSDTPIEGEDGITQQPYGASEIPSDAPFARQNDASNSERQSWDNEAPADEETVPHMHAEDSPPAREQVVPRKGNSDDVLSPEFWDKLSDKIPATPEKGKVEFNYPE